MDHNRVPSSRAELLAELSKLPRNAFITANYAAALVGSSPAVLANWRSQRRGPPYCGNGAFIRYRISDVEQWLSKRLGEVQLETSCVGAG